MVWMYNRTSVAAVQKGSEWAFVERRSKTNSFPYKLPMWGEVTSAPFSPLLPGLCVSPCGGPGGSPVRRERGRGRLHAVRSVRGLGSLCVRFFFAFRCGWLILLNKISPSVCRVRLN